MDVVFVEQTVEGRRFGKFEEAGRPVVLPVPVLVRRRTLGTEPFLDEFLLNISNVKVLP